MTTISKEPLDLDIQHITPAIYREYDNECEYEYIFNLKQIIGCNMETFLDLIQNKKKFIKEFKIKKSNGDDRVIVAPIGQLKRTNNYLKTAMFNSYSAHSLAYAYIKKKSGVELAQKLCGCKSKAEADLKNFFPNITKKHITNCLYGNKYICKKCSYYGRFLEGGCNSNLYKNREWIRNNEFHKVTCPEVLYFYSQKWRDDNPNYISLFDTVAELITLDGALCQGFPTSPVISNIVMRGFDKALEKFAGYHNLRAGRYCDNVFVVSDELGKKELDRLFKPFVFKKIKNFGFKVNYDKYNVNGKHSRMSCLGITINEHPNINKRFFKLQRAKLHRAIVGSEKHGIKPMYNLSEFKVIAGWWNYFNQINPKKAEPYIKIIREREAEIIELHKYEFKPEDYKDFKGIMIWPDGGAKGNKRNTGFGGYASYFNMNDTALNGSPRDCLDLLCKDKFIKVTNNQMELLAIISSMRQVLKRKLHESADDKNVLIISDSNYCIQCINSYLPNWKKTGLKKKGGIKNLNLWKLFIRMENRLKNVGIKLTYSWVPRNKYDGNIYADRKYNDIVSDESINMKDLFETIKTYNKA